MHLCATSNLERGATLAAEIETEGNCDQLLRTTIEDRMPSSTWHHAPHRAMGRLCVDAQQVATEEQVGTALTLATRAANHLSRAETC